MMFQLAEPNLSSINSTSVSGGGNKQQENYFQTIKDDTK